VPVWTRWLFWCTDHAAGGPSPPGKHDPACLPVASGGCLGSPADRDCGAPERQLRPRRCAGGSSRKPEQRGCASRTTALIAAAVASQVRNPSGQLSAHPSMAWGSRRLDPVTRLRSESAIAANVMPSHHRQVPPEERDMKQNKGRICRNFHIRWVGW
jgi:hypothetical protein